MTVRDIIDYIQVEVDDRVYWNDDKLINLINLIQIKMASDLQLVFQDYFTFPSTLDQRYLLPTNLVSIEELWFNNAGLKGRIDIVPSPKNVYGVNNDPDTDTSSQPYKAFIWMTSGRRELWVYPLFAEVGVDIKLFFWGIPVKLTNENDVPVLPIEWHIHLVEACINRCQQIDQQMTKAEEIALFQNTIRTCKSIETTAKIMERQSSIAQDRTLNTITDSFGLVDGSERGIFRGDDVV